MPAQTEEGPHTCGRIVRVELSAEFDRLRVVLVNPRNPLNIGAAARAMSNFGFLRMRVVNPYEAGYREARSAVGASAVLTAAEEFASLGEAVADCTLVIGTTAVGNRELHHRVKALPEVGRIIRKRLESSNVALLFGSERVGLSNEELSHCHWLLRIPTRMEHRSMNLGQAVAICVYELARMAGTADPRGRGHGQRRSNSSGGETEPRTVKEKSRKIAKQAAEKEPASAGDVERITTTLIDALHACGYLHAKSGAAPREKIRRLLRRHKLSANDADLWLSMLVQIAYKLRK
jgi:TrmH family RNA methyltransferase